MQFPWLEELVKKGHVSEAECNSIYADCAEIVKTAALSSEQMVAQAELAGRIGRGLTAVLGPLKLPITIGMSLVAARMLGKSDENKDAKATIDAIMKNRTHLLEQPEFAPHKAKAEARFDEIAGLAPTVARNPALMGRLLKDKLQSGLTTEDVNSLALIQASYTPRYSFQEKLTKKASDEMLGEMAADMVLICAEAGLTKTAAPGKMGLPIISAGLGKVLSHSLMLTAGPVLFGLGRGVVDHLSEMRNKTVRERRLAESFQAALDHPDADTLRDQPEKARQAFQALTHFSPSVAMQPTAARSFMKKLIDYKGDIHSGDIKDLASIEKDMRGTGPSPFLKGFREGADAAGFKDAFKSSLTPFTSPYSQQLESEVSTSLGLSRERNDRTRPGGSH